MALFSRYFLIITLLVLSACGDNNLEFQVRFEAVDGLKTGAQVEHQQEVIGRVENIEYSEEHGFHVHVEINEMSRYLATQSALFYIREPAESGAAALELVASKAADDLPIAEHQIVEGSSRLGGITQKFQNQLGGVLQAFSDGLKQSWTDLTEQTLDEQITYMDEELDRLASHLKDLGESAREQFEKEVLPRLEKQLESLRKQLEESDREDEIKPIEKKFDELSELVEV